MGTTQRIRIDAPRSTRIVPSLAWPSALAFSLRKCRQPTKWMAKTLSCVKPTLNVFRPSEPAIGMLLAGCQCEDHLAQGWKVLTTNKDCSVPVPDVLNCQDRIQFHRKLANIKTIGIARSIASDLEHGVALSQRPAAYACWGSRQSQLSLSRITQTWSSTFGVGLDVVVVSGAGRQVIFTDNGQIPR